MKLREGGWPSLSFMLKNSVTEDCLSTGPTWGEDGVNFIATDFYQGGEANSHSLLNSLQQHSSADSKNSHPAAFMQA